MWRGLRQLAGTGLLATAVLVTWAWPRSYRRCDTVVVEWTARTRLLSNRGSFRLVRDDDVPRARGSAPVRRQYHVGPYVRWTVAAADHVPDAARGYDGTAVGEAGLATAVHGRAGFGAAVDRSTPGRRRVLLAAPDWAVAVCLWVPALAIARSAASAVRADRRHRRGCCPACGFDLRGGHARCPECGRPTDTGRPPPRRRTWRTTAVAAGTVALAAVGYRVARPAIAAPGRSVDAIIRDVCVDTAGDLDPDIASGDWQPWTTDVDLNGDGAPERVVLFYPWQKYGTDPAAAAAEWEPHPTAAGRTTCFATAVLILTRQGAGWQPVGYYTGDDDVDGMPVTIDPTVRKGSTVVWTAEGRHADYLTLWGADRPGGTIGPMPGWAVPGLGTAQAVPRFFVREFYPQ